MPLEFPGRLRIADTWCAYSIGGEVQMHKTTWKPYVFWVLGVEAVGALSGFLTREGAEFYRESMRKPPLSPPGSVFPIVWGILFLLLGIGAALHYDNPEDPQSVEMIAMTARLGAAAAVAEIAELPAGDPLPALAAQAYAEVERIIR